MCKGDLVKNPKSLSLLAGVVFSLAGLQASASSPFAPKNYPANVYKCYTSERMSFDLALKTEDSLNPNAEKLIVTLEQQANGETLASTGVAVGDPSAFPTRTPYVAGPFKTNTTGTLGENSVKFVAQTMLDLRGVISGDKLNGGFTCQSKGEVIVLGQANGKYRPWQEPDVEKAKSDADQAAALICAGLHVERVSDYTEVWDHEMDVDRFLRFSVGAHYSCQALPV